MSRNTTLPNVSVEPMRDMHLNHSVSQLILLSTASFILRHVQTPIHYIKIETHPKKNCSSQLHRKWSRSSPLFDVYRDAPYIILRTKKAHLVWLICCFCYRYRVIVYITALHFRKSSSSSVVLVLPYIALKNYD